MKNVMSEMKVREYLGRLTEVNVKKVLFALGRMSGFERLEDSDIPELKHIADMFDGIITADFARQMAAALAEDYASKHPGVLMNKKDIKQYTHANFVKLYDVVGLRGFDYVLAVLREGKARVANPANGIDEERMLKAMRWEEARPDHDVALSNNYYHKRGLELLGFGEVAEMLKQHSYLIANCYELVIASAPASVDTPKSTVRQVKLHFIEKAELLQAFFAAEEPMAPKGYDKAQLAEGDMLLTLARKGQLKDSAEVLAYFEAKIRWDNVWQQIHDEFASDELAVIKEKPDAVKVLISNDW